MADSNVIAFPAELSTIGDLDPRQVLEGALDEELVGAIVIGVKSDGDTYFVSSLGYKPDVLWHIRQAEKRLLGMED